MDIHRNQFISMNDQLGRRALSPTPTPTPATEEITIFGSNNIGAELLGFVKSRRLVAPSGRGFVLYFKSFHAPACSTCSIKRSLTLHYIEMF
jgi:hypothetical protein